MLMISFAHIVLNKNGLNFSGVPPPVVIERYKYLLLALPPVYLVYDIAKKLIQIREVYVTCMFFMLQSNKCR
jgi:hypothetical protein